MQKEVAVKMVSAGRALIDQQADAEAMVTMLVPMLEARLARGVARGATQGLDIGMGLTTATAPRIRRPVSKTRRTEEPDFLGTKNIPMVAALWLPKRRSPRSASWPKKAA